MYYMYIHTLCLSQNGMTPLHHAAEKGKLDVCKVLCEHGAHPFEKDKVSVEAGDLLVHLYTCS